MNVEAVSCFLSVHYSFSSPLAGRGGGPGAAECLRAASGVRSGTPLDLLVAAISCCFSVVERTPSRAVAGERGGGGGRMGERGLGKGRREILLKRLTNLNTSTLQITLIIYFYCRRHTL